MADEQGLNQKPPELARTETTTSQPRRVGHRAPSFFWPLLLIGVGVLLLLSNLGYLPWESWNLLWRLWPLLLIALGIDVLVGRRSLVGAIISGILVLILIGGAVLIVLFARDIPAITSPIPGTEWRVEHVEYPLDGLESASVTIDWTSLPGHLTALTPSPNLIEGDVVYRGDLIFDVDRRGDDAAVELDTAQEGLVLWPSFPVVRDERPNRRWDVKISPDVALELTLDVGSGSCVFDLRELQIKDLFIDGGSGSLDLLVPETGSPEVYIDGGSGSMDINIPGGAGARIDLDSGSGSFIPDGRFRLIAGERGGDGVWETENFDTAEQRLRFAIDQGSGSLRID